MKLTCQCVLAHGRKQRWNCLSRQPSSKFSSGPELPLANAEIIPSKRRLGTRLTLDSFQMKLLFDQATIDNNRSPKTQRYPHTLVVPLGDSTEIWLPIKEIAKTAPSQTGCSVETQWNWIRLPSNIARYDGTTIFRVEPLTCFASPLCGPTGSSSFSGRFYNAKQLLVYLYNLLCAAYHYIYNLLIIFFIIERGGRKNYDITSSFSAFPWHF